jgi:hypothetical protein
VEKLPRCWASLPRLFIAVCAITIWKDDYGRYRTVTRASPKEKSRRQPLLSAAFRWTERSMVELDDLFL